MIGRTIAHYRILERVGSGGGGEVYAARDLRLDRTVALKLLPPELAADPESLERFRREARVLASLSHPNIVTIYSVEEADGTPFLTMEFVEGRTLADLIPPEGLPLEQFLRLVRPLLDSLCAAHGRGIIHRDLKPANVMVREDGTVKILDFGLAKRQRRETPDDPPLRTITRPGMLMGTLQYMSPEQIEGQAADARSDLFSLGAMLHEMLTGRRPFRGESGPSLISSIFRDQPVRVNEYRPGLPPALAEIILRCLEKEPDRRYQRATDLRDDLARVTSAEEDPRRIEEARAEPSPPGSGFPRARAPRAESSVGSPVSSSRPASSLGEPAASPAPPPRFEGGRVRLPFSRVLRWVLAVVVLAAAVYAPLRWLRPSGPKRIVVLPFENLGASDDAYFALGITEEITSRLAAVRSLGVISRTSALQYDAHGKTVRQIGRDLAVDYVLEGTVRWDRSSPGAERVLVTPQLIRVSDDTHLWSERYERGVGAIFEVQGEIAGEVVRRLDLTLREGERRALARSSTENLDAHLAYLRGMAYGRGSTEEDARLAVQMFEKAVSLDPEFVEAWYRLSRARTYVYYNWIDHSPEQLAQARQAAERALALAPDRPEGHMAMGNFYERALGDSDRALAEYRAVLELRPDDSAARFSIGLISVQKGEWQTGPAMMEAALELDPRNADLCEVLADVYQRLGRFAEAERMLDRAIAILPDDLLAWWRKADLYWCWDGKPDRARVVLEAMPKRMDFESTRMWWYQECYERNWQAALDRVAASPWEWFGSCPRAFLEYACLTRLGRPQAARAALEKARAGLEARAEETPDDPELHAHLGMVYAALGKREEALRASARISELIPISKDAFFGPNYALYQAKIDASLSEPAHAINRLESLRRIPSCVSPGILRLDPDWDRIRQDPRFRRLAEEPRGV